MFPQKRANDIYTGEYDEESTMLEDSVLPSRATYLQHNKTKQGKSQPMSVAVPAVIRPGSMGEITNY